MPASPLPTPEQLEAAASSHSTLRSPSPRAQPIAICGIGCRLPGGVDSSSRFWEMLCQGRSGQCEVPQDRFGVEAFYHPRGLDRPGSMNMRGGYFLQDQDVREFDNEFFGINNLEATYMDPQQRKLLEVVFESMEDAGVTLEAASGSNTGCYVGNFTMDFQIMQARDPEYFNRYSATGMGTTILSNRISHAFNLKGPSLVLDTACSSSLYCLHLACVALEDGECDAAVVAGVNLVLSPEQHLGTMKTGVLSPSSTCHTFDISADGYGRADGVGALYLKRLDDALRDGDPVRSVIRGSAINANGRTSGISLPIVDGQAAVIRKAYTKAGLDPSATTYVECHGTGTAVGDVIEVESLSHVFRRPATLPLLIGSAKANVGHSEAASGITSIIKCTLALEHGELPGTVGLRQRNPKLAFPGIEIPASLMPWTTTAGEVRRASVNSFGYGGANAHAILEDAQFHLPANYGEAAMAEAEGPHRLVLLPISAADAVSFDHRVRALKSHHYHNVRMADLAHTLGSRRSHMSTRGYLLPGRDEPLAQRISEAPLHTVVTGGSHAYPITFVFTGQGAQWPGMGRELFEEFAVFRNTIRQMDVVLQQLPQGPSWTLEEALLRDGETGSIYDPVRSQPVCTALQVALVQLLESWDIFPDSTIGHSSGEIGAAFAAGLVSSAEAITIAYYRGYLASKSQHSTSQLTGGMIAVGLSREAAETELSKHAGLVSRLQVACVNSPDSTTVSGDADAVDILAELLVEKGIFHRKLSTGGIAYHSYHMLALGEEYQCLLEEAFSLLGTSHRVRRMAKFISTVTSAQVTAVDPAYWRSNLESPTLFAPAVEALLTKSGGQEECSHLIELGPHSTMQLPLKQIRMHLHRDEQSMRYSSALRRHEDGLACVLGLVGSLWLHGHDIPFDVVNGICLGSAHGGYKTVQGLPNYPWHYRGILWNESRPSREFRGRRYPRHELLGSLMPGGNGLDLVWRNVIRVEDVSWLKDHRLENTPVFPAAGYLAMAMEAMLQAADMSWSQSPCFQLEDVHIFAALPLPEENSTASAAVELFTVLSRKMLTYTSDSATVWEFKISSYRDGVPTAHARGSIMLDTTMVSVVPQVDDPAVLEAAAAGDWYDRLQKGSLNYGPSFRSIEAFRVPRARRSQFCQAIMPLKQSLPADHEPYAIHPISIDAMLQACIVATTSGVSADLRAKVPTRIALAMFSVPDLERTAAEQENAVCSAIARRTGFGTAVASAELTSSLTGTLCGMLHEVRFAPYVISDRFEEEEEKADHRRHPMCRVVWRPDVYGLGLPPASHISQVLGWEQTECSGSQEEEEEGLGKLGALLELVVHKNPGLRILQVGGESTGLTKRFLGALQAKSDFPRFRTFSVASVLSDDDDDGSPFMSKTPVDLDTGESKPKSEGVSAQFPADEEFDLILLPTHAEKYLSFPEKESLLRRHLAPDGLVLARTSREIELPHTLTGEAWPCGPTSGTSAAETKGIVILAQTSVSKSNSLPQASYFVIHQAPSRLSTALVEHLCSVHSLPTQVLNFNDLSSSSIPAGSIVFSLLEYEKPVLATVSPEELSRIKLLTDHAARVVWITGGNPLEGLNPDMMLVNGLARSLMLEQPALQFFTYHVSQPASLDDAQTAINIAGVLFQQGLGPQDFEFCEFNGVPYVSRFAPDETLNAKFRSQNGAEERKLREDRSLDNVRATGGARLSIERPGQFDTIYYQRLDEIHDEVQRTTTTTALGPTEVQLQVRSVGLNVKDFNVFGGKVDTENATTCSEYTGVVERVGAEVVRVQVGDRVVVMAPSHFQTCQVVPEWACARLQDDEDEHTLSCIAHATALYALHHRANLQPGESVLIHSAADGVGLAAIQVAQCAGATVLATVSSDAQKAHLIAHCHLPENHIFSCEGTTFLPAVLAATHGRGVDVVLNSLTGDQLHASWRVCASFGRFIEIGNVDLSNSGKLEMRPFLNNVTFTAINLSHLYNNPNTALRRTWSSLLDDVLCLHRAGLINTSASPTEVFDITQLPQALRRFSSPERIGEIVISLEDPTAVLPMQPARHNARFYPHKSYILVGCLGGLGRSISRWMVRRGARQLVFLGRSGTSKPAARALVEELQSQGVHCTVIQGDVRNLSAVERLMTAARYPIGGVIQAAMGVDAALFSQMTTQAWHAAIDPKVHGTWNLHRALQNTTTPGSPITSLDFFLSISSISGSVGSAAEANYCAANHFLDAFARYQRAQGFPAMALGLGMVTELGFLHDHPEIATMLARKGVRPIREEEVLQLVDAAIFNAIADVSNMPASNDPLSKAHLLTGLETDPLCPTSTPISTDPRAILLSLAATTTTVDKPSQSKHNSNESRTFPNLPTEIMTAIKNCISLSDAVLTHIAARFGSLVLMAVSEVDTSRPLAKYGMDSMLAAEFRNWVFGAFRVDVPFLMLLGKSCTLRGVGEMVSGEVAARLAAAI
ncbi:hypothetical protein ASPBRDRAFT_37382 [Aspergillus brasiliensis CBS 101740]|uniref:Carrier domain-containing protein n=1 Tax=Aspergillus brasiliensis (strain CBS 101740 / IMI 381727 / IBT 21946) TaxID=767769 RepID=A0A1L9V2P6_ASPBC|nr:hypothetical protein ASPBRDRAFT_37382 [Aspergillus brasiliensis CBS 101740]